MELASNTVLVTGGASGIGLALAERFIRAGSKVLVCGRREERLRELAEMHPGVVTRVSDVAREEERVALIDWATSQFPALNVLVNNAGIQRYPVLADSEDWEATRSEIAINFDAPVHLSRLVLPHLLRRPHGAIVNITSGLSFAPLARAPIYSATKAALHSFTVSLRHQLKGSLVEVIEIIPPAVDTDLGGPGLHAFGVPVGEFVDAVAQRLEKGEIEIGYDFAEKARRASRAELDEMFARMNQRSQRT
jgi:uncharacterized oxidoreductase